MSWMKPLSLPPLRYLKLPNWRIWNSYHLYCIQQKVWRVWDPLRLTTGDAEKLLHGGIFMFCCMCFVYLRTRGSYLCLCVRERAHERVSGRIALVYHYHVDATVLSIDVKGHINSIAASSHAGRSSSSGILRCMAALSFTQQQRLPVWLAASGLSAQLCICCRVAKRLDVPKGV